MDGFDGEEGTWSLDGNVLSLSGKESDVYVDDSGNEVSCSETETGSVSVSIVDGRLYFETLNRVSGNGAGLGGRWKTFEDEYAVGTVEGVHYEEQEIETASIQVTGDSFSMTVTEKGFAQEDGEPETFDDSESSKGSVSNNVVLFVDEAERDNIALDDPSGFDYYCDVYGYRLTDDIILLSVLSAEQVEDEAYVKIN